MQDLGTPWIEESVSGYSVDISDGDISNDDISDLEYDIQIKCPTKPIFDIWEPDCLLIDLQVGYSIIKKN